MTPTSIRNQLMSDHSDYGIHRNRAGRASLVEGDSKKSKQTGMRRCTLAPSFKLEPTRVNASWESSTSRRRSRLQLETPATPMTSPVASRESRKTLLDNGELESLIAKLWSNQFAGTIDPRFHSEYVQGTV
jgi:hypothetical protein